MCTENIIKAGAKFMIYDIKLIKEKVTPICQQWQIGKLLLFGSYAKGEATEESDIDFVVYDTNKSLTGAKFYALVGDLRDAFMPIQVEVLEDVEHEKLPWLSDVLAKEGILIYETGSSTSAKN